MVKLLLEKGATVDAQDSNGNTPLHMACEQGHVQVSTFLVQQGALPDRMDASGRTAYDHAVAANSRQASTKFDMIRSMLVENGGTESAPPKDWAATFREAREWTESLLKWLDD